ncbi:MAG: GcrA cell cycle regulator [Hoeflea sp.]|uniref:GcrA family cell cycle regulator n=1 Tax=Hoeflea sp. TaxID=1940281 RepID=UPI000C0F626A|nr:GcrA family cell cycle regulator [Hoeflea sp.]PHR18124.1 MAG: GcrA cell cycle regulator [Hoeflea sp.]|tara:strand:- start:55443 stop:55970 length:528 start_codon:yes stop_codon:yes gene_type:complete
MNWTDERVERLKKLWADGLSASQIAAQLGGVSRNAVIGKVHRLNLPGRAKSGGQASVRTKRTTAAPRAPNYAGRTTQSQTSRPVGRSSGGAALKQDLDVVASEEIDTRPVDDVVVPISRRLTLVELSERTCKWPVGDPLQDDFHFCGNDSGDASPYCGYHAKLAFQPSSERKRAR